MKQWLKYVKKYWYYFVISAVCMAIDITGEVVMPKFLADIIDEGVVNRDIRQIVVMTVFMMLTALMMLAGGVGSAYFGARASSNFAADLRKDVYDKVQEFSFSNIDHFSTGSLVTRLTNDVTQIQNFVNMLMRMGLRAPGMLIGGLVMATVLCPSLARILLLVMPLMVLGIVLIIRKAFPLFNDMQEKLDALNSNIRENVTNIRVVKSFVREEHEEKKFGKINENLKNAGLHAMKLMVGMQPFMMLFMYITTLMVLWFGGNTVMNGNLELGNLTAFLTYVTQILNSLIMVSVLFVVSTRAAASGHRIQEVLKEEVSLKDTEETDADLKVTEGKVEFRHVGFRYYSHSEDQVLSDISCTIEAGQTVGIIGSTGCGKTTLVSMIPRLYDVDRGEVLIDGVNVKKYSLRHLREAVGMVLQNNTLFSGTVKDNLLWGDEDATDEMIHRAARWSQADDFIRDFHGGYDYSLDHGGLNVSGGQKQRLCIARALLKKPKILILDDSTSAVDMATEAKIREMFREELQNTTKIIISQRIASVMDADQIIVMDDGRITGTGCHEELLRSNEEYREIYESQMNQKEATV